MPFLLIIPLRLHPPFHFSHIRACGRLRPVFDSHHAAWAGVLATINDMFFMALMFFVSGLLLDESQTQRLRRVYG